MNTKVREEKSAAVLKTASLLLSHLKHYREDKERGKMLVHYSKVLSVLTFFFFLVLW